MLLLLYIFFFCCPLRTTQHTLLVFVICTAALTNSPFSPFTLMTVWLLLIALLIKRWVISTAPISCTGKKCFHFNIAFNVPSVVDVVRGREVRDDLIHWPFTYTIWRQVVECWAERRKCVRKINNAYSLALKSSNSRIHTYMYVHVCII